MHNLSLTAKFNTDMGEINIIYDFDGFHIIEIRKFMIFTLLWKGNEKLKVEWF